ncbi:MAG: protein phosphatase 2C domain-containing protein [Aeromicrobium sp.]|uniref:protein phosphatase 2C domain-containing protein n=1 Tax=Aeromicrobium sp. TaxID=1871063 RepID=UPI0039E49AB4
MGQEVYDQEADARDVSSSEQQVSDSSEITNPGLVGQGQEPAVQELAEHESVDQGEAPVVQEAAEPEFVEQDHKVVAQPMVTPQPLLSEHDVASVAKEAASEPSCVRCVATTVRGSSKGEGRVCEDWSYAGPQSPDHALLIVCDGVGSARDSSIGARRAGEIAREEVADVRTLPKSEEWVGIFGRIRDRWLKEFSDPADFSTTLTIALAGPGGLSVGSLGDSFAVVLRELEKQELRADLVIVRERIPGRPLNVTDSLLSVDWNQCLQTEFSEDPANRALLLSTDGLEYVALRASRDEVTGTVRDVLRSGVVDNLLADFWEGRVEEDSRALCERFLQDAHVMTSKGDDIGVSLAAW